MTDWQAVRRGYPAALDKTYLDTAHRGLPADRTVQAVREFCDLVRTCPGATATEDTVQLIAAVARAREAAAALINADPDEIALVESTQHGLMLAADLAGLQPGDRVVAGDIEFAGTVLPWRSRGAHGAELVLVPNRGGDLHVGDFADAIDARTRVVTVSAVQETNGFRIDLDALGQLCRERSVTLVVDGIQHVGALRFDVRTTPADFLAVGAHKWLGSPFGLGLLYVRRELLASLEPRFRGHTSIADPPEGWDAYITDPGRHPLEEHRFATGARKFEVAGTPNFAGALALEAAIASLLDLGAEAVEARVLELSGSAAQALVEVGATPAASIEPEHRSGIVTFRVGDDPADERSLAAALASAGVSTGVRFVNGVGGIRTAFHVYNDENDIDRLVDTVSSWMRQTTPGRHRR